MKVKFGDYVLIEQKRYGVDNEMYRHKVIATLQSNIYVDVPVQSPATEIDHGKMVDVANCICCGVMETGVRKYKIADITKEATDDKH